MFHFRKNHLWWLALLIGLVGCTHQPEEWQFTGVVEGTVLRVPSLTGGQIASLLVEEGDRVAAGALIALIDSTELHLEKTRLLAVQEELASQIDLARAQLLQARADLELATQTFQRLDQLHRQGTIPTQKWDEARNRLQRARSAYQAARQQLQTLQARRKQVSAQLALLKKKLADTRIRAPISGVVSTRFYETGEAVPPLGSVVELLQLDTVWTKIYLSESMLPHVLPGDSARIVVDGLEETLSGTVSWISPQAEFTPKNILTPETRTALVFAVKITIPNPQSWLKRGMPVEVHLFPRSQPRES